MKQLSVFFVGLASLVLASCGQGDVLFADDAVINLSPVDDNPSAGYMTLHGGRQDTELVSVVSDDVLRLEMHETVTTDGVATMKPLKSVAVPAGGKVKFEPGGKHLMIWGIGQGSRNLGLLRMTLIYANDDRIQIEAVIKKQGSAE